MKRAAEPRGFGDRHPAVERMPLRQIGNAAAHLGGQGGDLVPQQLDPAVAGLGHPQQHLDRRRLAGPVAAQETIHASRPERAGPDR